MKVVTIPQKPSSAAYIQDAKAEANSGKGNNTLVGSLMGVPQCRMSILRNGNVSCHYSFYVDY